MVVLEARRPVKICKRPQISFSKILICGPEAVRTVIHGILTESFCYVLVSNVVLGLFWALCDL